ncbi:MAG: hypothetical protein AAFZ11_04610 [Pseudomonadota bacterium]
MNPWPIRIAVIGGMGTAFALWLIATPFYLTACYDFDFACSNEGLWRALFLAGPPLIGTLTGVTIVRIMDRFCE